MAVRFQTNIPQSLLFPYGDFMEVNGQYGVQFLYTVEVDGERDRLYATPTLHQELQSAGVGPGNTFVITKIEGDGNRKSWVVEAVGNNGHAVTEAPPPSTVASNGHARVTSPLNFESLEMLLNRCLGASWRAWQGLDDEASFSSEDVRAVGISIFLECARKGVIPSHVIEEEGVPF